MNTTRVSEKVFILSCKRLNFEHRKSLDNSTLMVSFMKTYLGKVFCK